MNGFFEELKQLPPNREIDHKIPIKAGGNPINVRPYKYPHLLKTEIEKQVEEMMKIGIIRPSNSPYSSPLILIKKKDGSSRFCVDYKVLSKATILDKFPIPLIEELLDELYGAHYFPRWILGRGITRSACMNQIYIRLLFALTMIIMKHLACLLD